MSCSRSPLFRPLLVRPLLVRSLAALLLPLALLAGCGDLPQPYRGRPGGNAAALAVPMTIRLAIPAPDTALLDARGAPAFSEALAAALLAAEVPAIATEQPLPLDWRVLISAERSGASVRPRYRLIDADGKEQAVTEGDRIPARAWESAEPATLQAAATLAAQKLTRLILAIEAGRKASDPLALTAGPPRLRMAGVSGAPGDGNAALAKQITSLLTAQGFIVQDAAQDANFALHGEVTVAPSAAGKDLVEIVWVVSRRDGLELGKVAQLNEVPSGRLNRVWGDVAYAAAAEAADGVRTVVANAIAPREGETPSAAAQALATPQPGAAWAGPRMPPADAPLPPPTRRR